MAETVQSMVSGDQNLDDYANLQKIFDLYKAAAGSAYEWKKGLAQLGAEQERLTIPVRGEQERETARLLGEQQLRGIATTGEQERLAIPLRGLQERLGLETSGAQQRLGIAASGEEERKGTVTRGQQERETVGKTAEEQRRSAEQLQQFRQLDELRDYTQAQRAYRYWDIWVLDRRFRFSISRSVLIFCCWQLFGNWNFSVR